MRTRTIVAAGVAALLSAGHLSAQPAREAGAQGGRGMRGGEGMMARMARALDLTEEQKESLRASMEAQKTQRQALHQKMRENRQQLRTLLKSANPDPAAVGRLAIEGQRLREQARARREEARQALRAQLTPEQQAKLEAIEALKPERGRGRGPAGKGRGPWGPGGRGDGGPER